MFIYLGVAIFGVTLEDSAHMFVKRQELTQFVFIISTRIKREDWKECDMKKYVLFCLTFITVRVEQSKS